MVVCTSTFESPKGRQMTTEESGIPLDLKGWKTTDNEMTLVCWCVFVPCYFDVFSIIFIYFLVLMFFDNWARYCTEDLLTKQQENRKPPHYFLPGPASPCLKASHAFSGMEVLTSLLGMLRYHEAPRYNPDIPDIPDPFKIQGHAECNFH